MLKAGEKLLKGPRVLDVFPFDSNLRKEAEKFQSLAQSAQGILISSTLTSDGDSIGAQLGMLSLLKALRKQGDQDIWIVDQSPVPQRYQFLKGSEKILDIDSFRALKNKPTFDLGITCDGGTERTGDVAEYFSKIPKVVLVDHHAVGSDRSYDSRMLDLNVSSTCELVYLLHEFFNVEVTKELAEALYVGIVFDTGFFKHSLTKPHTHLVAAHLISTGIDFSKISDRAILERSWEAQLLLKQMLDNMQRLSDGKIILSHWSKNELDQIPFKDGDQEGMINQLYYTDSAEVVVLMTEKVEGDVKVSFRSKGKVNVAELARRLHPEGGGHVRAAGCSLALSLEEARKLILSELRDALR